MEIRIVITEPDQELQPGPSVIDLLWDRLVSGEAPLALFKDYIREGIEVFMMQQGINPEIEATELSVFFGPQLDKLLRIRDEDKGIGGE